MAIRELVDKVKSWLFHSYPQGVPEQDLRPLLGVLSQRLTNPEIMDVVDTLITRGLFSPDRTDVAVEITKITDELPSERDMERVRERLTRVGFPVNWPGESGEYF